MTYETILFEVSDNVGTITLNRPDKLNSFNAQMHADVADVLQRAIADDTIRCLLLTGAGRGFCAGQDLSTDGWTRMIPMRNHPIWATP